MAPRNNINKNRQNGVGFLSYGSPLFQPGQFTSKDLHTPFFFFLFVSNMLYVLLHVTRGGKKIKANTSVIYMDHVVSTMLLLSTKQNKKNVSRVPAKTKKGKHKLKHRKYTSNSGLSKRIKGICSAPRITELNLQKKSMIDGISDDHSA